MVVRDRKRGERNGGQRTDSQVLEELVSCAASGDKEAQQQLLESFWPLIRQAVRGRNNRLGRRLAAREQTRDLEQAAAIKLLTGLSQHAWQGTSAFGAWVKKIAEHEVADVYRHHAAQRRSVDAETELKDSAPIAGVRRSLESVIDDHHRVEELLNRISGLKPEYGSALVMYHMGYSHAQIGDALGCSGEAARKLVTRARKRLLEHDGNQEAVRKPEG